MYKRIIQQTSPSTTSSGTKRKLIRIIGRNKIPLLNNDINKIWNYLKFTKTLSGSPVNDGFCCLPSSEAVKET